MILEVANIFIDPEQADEFKQNLVKAREVISQSQGFRGIDFKQGIEKPGHFILLIQWETLEDHTERFRKSDLFTQWRALIGPFFNQTPEVSHFNNLNLK
jgi:heme-degrading monooxygenase HmoA